MDSFITRSLQRAKIQTLPLLAKQGFGQQGYEKCLETKH
ncbi:hypothetical protein EVA_10904 [gut metagenome]|uniref:Uncharacterized protein n=1 Tax=gut metagenome TaxID=749906 RepID=J9GMD3_9ZZZZ